MFASIENYLCYFQKIAGFKFFVFNIDINCIFQDTLKLFADNSGVVTCLATPFNLIEVVVSVRVRYRSSTFRRQSKLAIWPFLLLYLCRINLSILEGIHSEMGEIIWKLCFCRKQIGVSGM